MAIIWNITYLSTETQPFSRSQLFDLLARSRAFNTRADITGLLLYKQTHFMQVLEGPRGAVEDLYRKIRTDERHFDVITLISERILKRSFHGWSMGFRDLSFHGPMQPAGFSDMLNKPWKAEDFISNSAHLRICLDGFMQ
jgi:hypothetical protein